MRQDKVLVFSSREICYFSSNFFANQIAAAFEKLGMETEVCELTKGDDLDEKLECYIGESYRLILDFNSMLPRMVLVDDSSYLDNIDAPFYDYILDHPLFHYNGLNGAVSNFHAIALDEAQTAYIRRFHPQIKTVHTMPLAATEASGRVKNRHLTMSFLWEPRTARKRYISLWRRHRQVCGK